MESASSSQILSRQWYFHGVSSQMDAELQLSGHLDNYTLHREGEASSSCLIEFILNCMHWFYGKILKYLLRFPPQMNKQTHTHMKSSFG